MRFGHNLHQHVLPEWYCHYIDYNLLKRLAKPPLDDGHNVYAELQDGLDKVEAFVGVRLRIADTTNRELCMLFGLDPEADSIPNAAQVCPFELTLLLEAFHESRQDLLNLHWFERVNAEAVERILDKLARREQAGSQAYLEIRARWETLRMGWEAMLSRRLRRCESLIADAVDGLRDTHRTAGTSLYFARVRRGRESLGGIVDQLAEAVHRCDFRAARDVLADARRSGDASNSGYLEGVQDLDGELFTYAAMLHSAEAKTSYFDHEGPLLSQETLKWAILAAGRRQKLDSKPNLVPHRRHHYAAGFKHLRRIMELCVERAPDALATADSLDRLPLHYAAMYGVSGLVDYVGKSPQTEVGTTGSELQPLELRDIEGLTPMHMTVMANQSKSVAELTDILGHNVHARPYEAEEIARELLPIALLNQSRDGNRTTTPLPLADALAAGGKRALAATQVEKASFASIMCEWLSLATDNDRGSFEVTDRRGWTPLFYACALGYYDIAKRLLDLGCSQTRTDDLGWTAQEHAALNGHLAVAELFELSELRNMNDGPARVSEKRVVHPKLYCTEGERVIVASLGSERVNDAVTEVNLPYCSSPYNPGSYDGFSYALQVSAPGTTAQPRVVRLPILDDQINEPFVFPIPATVGPQLVFRVFRQGPGTDNQGVEVGCGTALLEANTKHFGVGRQSLIRELTIPILDRDTMATAGTVTFTFMVANHFPHLRTSREVDFARNSINPPVLIGHRGLGMNLNTQKYLQIGENTVESFLAAGKLGASFVEFDFQVTKDREAVIFHDFSLSQSGTDVPVHDVTLDQFLYAGNIQSPHGNPLSVLGPIHARNEPVGQRRRSRSVGGHFEAGAIQIRDRMKHTVDYKLKGFKPNTRGDFIQDSFATLKELLVQVPEHVGFDIEIKYPRLHEATDAGVAPVALELNTFVDVALQTLHQHAGSRPVILSSFTPEICILLSLKQKAYPVFFITNAGKAPMIDFERRAASVQVAVRFAQRWNLAGVVFSCEALLLAPRLVGYVKGRGLVCATYGTPNNVLENVRRQADSGVDVIIADRVRLVAETLTDPVPN